MPTPGTIDGAPESSDALSGEVRPVGLSVFPKGSIEPLDLWNRKENAYAGIDANFCKETAMKVAYVFSTSGHTASYKLGQMILPQLEDDAHGVEVVGMMFFDDNTYLLRKGDSMGQRLAKVAQEKGILLMMCDSCAMERGLAEGGTWPEKCKPKDTVEGVQVGCFPDLYSALAAKPPDHIITL